MASPENLRSGRNGGLGPRIGAPCSDRIHGRAHRLLPGTEMNLAQPIEDGRNAPLPGLDT
jgi:hypothetical protein